MFYIILDVVGQQTYVSHAVVEFLTYVIMSMGVIGLKGFLTDEHHSWVVVAAGGVVGGGQGVVAVVVTWHVVVTCHVVVPCHTVLWHVGRRLGHRVGVVCVGRVVVLLVARTP